MTLQQEVQYEMWKERLKGRFTDEKDFTSVMSYVADLLERDLPVILGINHLASLMGIAPDTLKSMVASAPSFYRTFSIPKRRGGHRQIDAPYPSMLSAQRWIYHNILSKVAVNDAAMGFISKRSIVDNAFVHKGKECVLMMDVKDFFPSIKWYKVYSVFKRMGYPQHIAQYLASLCCLNGSVPQGAVTSPCLSNIICRRLDVRVSNMAKAFNILYTRYADDVTFSGEKIPVKFAFLVSYIFSDEGFRLNEQKTKLIRGRHKKIVTGISISSGRLTIPKCKKRQIRQMVYYIRKYGIKEHQRYIGNNDPVYLERIIGYLHFWQFVEPANQFVGNALCDMNKMRASKQAVDIGDPPQNKPISFSEYVLQFTEEQPIDG